jgi:hypothetical protein
MTNTRIAIVLVLLTLAAPAAAPAQVTAAVPQTQEDDYTRYELLAPGTAQFRILYEVTGTKAGAPYFFNVIRKGSVATDERVNDAATGESLKWEVVTGEQARKDGHPTAQLDAEWIKVYLRRPIPEAGEARVIIDKTYKDEKSYFRDGDAIVFDRSLGIRRNAVVLPAGYRLISSNVPSQVMAAADGRVMITFLNTSAAAAPLVIRARPGLAAFTPALSTAPGTAVTMTMPSLAARLSDRAHQDREAVFLLDDPASHGFTLQHDYTESRAGLGHYISTAATGSRVTAASARNLDTGETLKTEVMTGAEMARQDLEADEPVARTGQGVVVSFPRVPVNGSTRVRLTETHVDEARYLLEGDELVFDRVLDRARNTVVLPAGWTVIASSMPTTVTQGADGRQRLYLENSRPDTLHAHIRARRVQP